MDVPFRCRWERGFHDARNADHSIIVQGLTSDFKVSVHRRRCAKTPAGGPCANRRRDRRWRWPRHGSGRMIGLRFASALVGKPPHDVWHHLLEFPRSENIEQRSGVLGTILEIV